ncbi:MAG: HIRAN domain-containing protein [Bacteroidota bacterium]|nr:HIRAN domain-containing protein [Bacteroidota bacterium]
MNRIDFLKQLLLGGALLFVPKHSSENVPKATKEIRLSSPYIAGFQYYQGVELEQMLKENDPLMLKRKAQNPHDCNAIEVFSGSSKLGYLPREENKVIARMMDQGLAVKARIVKVNTEEHPYRKVKMKVFYEV